MKYVIYNPEESELQDEPMFWSNEQGWGDLESADFYSAPRTITLPIDGIWLGLNDPLEPDWDNNYVQFARLIAEINATVDIKEEDWKELCESMDLQEDEVNQLFDRALQVFEQSKERIEL